jgi:hypothetical protein
MFQTVTYPNNQNNKSANMVIEEPQQEEPKKYKSIIELQNEINFYKNKERLYKIQLIEKQKKIDELKELKSYYENIKNYHSQNPPDKYRRDHIFDPKTQKLIYVLKKIIEDKNSILVSLEEELYSSSNQAREFFFKQITFLEKENSDIFKYLQGNNIENFRKANNHEKSQLNALLVKILECQENIKDLLKNLEEINDTSSTMKRTIEEKNEK